VLKEDSATEIGMCWFMCERRYINRLWLTEEEYCAGMASGGASCMNSLDMDAPFVSMGSQRYDGQVLEQQRLDSQVTMDALAGPRGE